MKQTYLGSWLTLGNPSIAEIMADAGFDWLCVDLEHTSTDYKEAQLLIMAIQSKGLKAFVRVGGNDPLIIKRVLDSGADGIIVPSVNSALEAKNAVEAVRYPPMGKRGVGLARAQDYGFGFDSYRDHKTKEIKLYKTNQNTMGKNYTYSFKGDLEFDNLLKEVLEKLKKEIKVRISKSDLIRVSVHRILMELKTGQLKSTVFFHNTT